MKGQYPEHTRRGAHFFWRFRMNALSFPTIKKVRISNFSLYSQVETIIESIKPGVFCLVGANGLGKSTFLNMLMYSITGIVNNPAKKFRSVEEFYPDNLSYAIDYFTGRVSENDRDASEIEVYLSFDDLNIRVVRGLFEQEQLRDLEVFTNNQECTEQIPNYSELTPIRKSNEYKKIITERVGLKSFEQFVFLYNSIFLFDETRDLIFWNKAKLQQALFIAFGVNLDDALMADSLKREIEKQDSLARNRKWQASGISKKISTITEYEKNKEDLDVTSVENEHRLLLEKYESERKNHEELANEYNATNLLIAETSSQITALTAQYQKSFSEIYQKISQVELNPIIRNTITEGRCAICGASGDVVIQIIRDNIDQKKCPLCLSTISKTDDSEKNFDILVELDDKLNQKKLQLAEIIKKYERLKSELSGIEKNINNSKTILDEYEYRNRQTLNFIKSSSLPEGKDQILLEQLKRQLDDYNNEITTFRQTRDSKKEQLTELQNKIEQNYFTAEKTFVPMFKDLANLFLGLDLGISMGNDSGGLFLAVDVNNSIRWRFDQLSESQRFFLDIALRMSLLQFMSNEHNLGSLFIDTPEGSLDIAYEERAGSMFSRFAGLGFNIIMTANLNTSQLLLSLAEKCKNKYMQLCKMTDWAELSDVQRSEEHRFIKTYSEIEQMMDRKDNSDGN